MVRSQFLTMNSLFRLFAAICFALTLSSVSAAEPFQWGVNGHPLSQTGYWDVPIAAQLDLVSELGAKWYRIDISAGSFAANTSRFDEMLAEAERRNIRLLPVLMSSPGGRSTKASPVEIREAARAFGKTIASRYKGRITHWELSNELDGHAMIHKGEKCRSGRVWIWDGDPDGGGVDDYEQSRYENTKAEIQGLYEGVKDGNPQAITIVDTAGWLHYGFIERLVKEDRVPFDVLAWHWYSEMGDITNVQGKLNLLELLKGYGKPLSITEINRRDGSKHGKEAEQADYINNAVGKLAENPAINGMYIYELLDEPYFGDGGESDYGLVRLAKNANGKWDIAGKKKAFDAFKAVIAAAKRK